MLHFRTALLVAAVAAISVADRASAAPASSAGISVTQIDPATFQYDLDLTNGSSSTTPVGTFWYAWTPGQDYMAVSPTDITSPAGWTAKITGGGATDGFAIQWVASNASADLAPGGSLAGFSYESADTPAVEFGDSPFFPTTPVGTSFTYSTAPFSAGADQFVVAAATPEPALLTLAVPAALLWRRRRAEAADCI